MPQLEAAVVEGVDLAGPLDDGAALEGALVEGVLLTDEVVEGEGE